jgi:hypothetical protein
MSRQVGEFSLENDEKVDRAINGTVGRDDQARGGLVSKHGEGNIPDAALLAEYDRLGGLIKKGDLKVKTGSFYDFQKKQPREKPELRFSMAFQGRVLDVNEEKAQAILMAQEELARANSEILEDEDEEGAKPEKKRKVGSKKAKKEDTEEEETNE